MASHGARLVVGTLLALLCAASARGDVTADLILSLRYWHTDTRDETRLDNFRLLADADLDRALGLHLDYDRQGEYEENLAEAYGDWSAGRQRVRLGRFLLPFGIYNRSELYYVGLLIPPILKDYLGNEYQIGRSEHGLGYINSSGRWQIEGAFFAARGGWKAVIPSGGEGAVRLQYFADPVILGLSALREHGEEPQGGARGTARFVGLDFRYGRPSLILRGELVSGSVPGGSPRGFYLDVLYHPAALHDLTLVGRVESARGLEGQESYRRQTVGLKWDLGRGTALALNQAFDSPRFRFGQHGTTLYLWHIHRL
jgi:hypothetical protein